MTTELRNQPIQISAPAWPECQWRVQIDDRQLSSELATCRHQRVRTPGQLVTSEICGSCTLRLTESPPAIVRSERTGCCGSRPTLLQKGWSAAMAVAQFIADGAWTLTPEQYRARLEVCETCDQRRVNTCTVCGCNLTLKSRGRAFQCPLGKWPVTEESG